MAGAFRVWYVRADRRPFPGVSPHSRIPRHAMPRKPRELLHIGVGSHVVAIDAATGTEMWRTRLKMASFVTVVRRGKRVYAGAAGWVFALDAATGELLWTNKLKGLGMGLVTFAGDEAAAGATAAATAAAAAAATAATAAAAG